MIWQSQVWQNRTVAVAINVEIWQTKTILLQKLFILTDLQPELFTMLLWRSLSHLIFRSANEFDIFITNQFKSHVVTTKFSQILPL